MALYAIDDRIPRIHPDAFVHPDVTIIGGVTVGARSSIWPGAVLRGDHGDICVGEDSSIQDGTIVHATASAPTLVGNGCVVGHLVHLHGCTIEDGAMVGSSSTVLHHAVIRSGALVGAGALVTSSMDVPSGAMALGVPARIRADCVKEGVIASAVEEYVRNARWYKTSMRRVD